MTSLSLSCISAAIQSAVPSSFCPPPPGRRRCRKASFHIAEAPPVERSVLFNSHCQARRIGSRARYVVGTMVSHQTHRSVYCFFLSKARISGNRETRSLGGAGQFVLWPIKIAKDSLQIYPSMPIYLRCELVPGRGHKSALFSTERVVKIAGCVCVCARESY